MLAMPLLLLDLDNTLLPRDAAFRAWAQDFLTELGLPLTEIDWLVTIDGGGYVPRSTVLSAARRRYGLDHSFDYLLAHYRRGINSHISCPTRHIDALRAARSAGWTLGIVSNGGTRPQLEKIRRTGLGSLVDGWVISEEAECIKPDPLIFEIAARRCGVAPTGDWTANTWMIGDYAPADIAGAELTGLRSVWLHHGRPWSEPGYRPTLSAAGLTEAIGLVLSARNAPTPRAGARSGGPSRRPTASASERALPPTINRTSAAPDPDPEGIPDAVEAPCADGTPVVRNLYAGASPEMAGPVPAQTPLEAHTPKPRLRTHFAVPASSLAPRSASISSVSPISSADSAVQPAPTGATAAVAPTGPTGPTAPTAPTGPSGPSGPSAKLSAISRATQLTGPYQLPGSSTAPSTAAGVPPLREPVVDYLAPGAAG